MMSPTVHLRNVSYGHSQGMYPYSDAEVAQQAEAVKVMRSGNRRRSVCVTIKRARTENAPFLPLFKRRELWRELSATPLFLTESRAAANSSLHGAKLFFMPARGTEQRRRRFAHTDTHLLHISTF